MEPPSEPVVLPFKSEKISFSLSFTSEAAPLAQVELVCVCFDREGQVLDYVQFNRRAALNGALKHSACSYLPRGDAVGEQGDEAVHMYPFEFAPQCEVMLLLASAPSSALRRNDLGASGRLRFRVHARELGREQMQLIDADLSAAVAGPAAAGAGPLSSGHQTMAIAGVFTQPQGWTLGFDCTTFPEDSWGLLLPELRAVLRRWPGLSAAAAAGRLPRQVVVDSRRGSDLPLTAALWPQEAAPEHKAAAPAAAAAAAEVFGAGAASDQLGETDAAGAQTAAPAPALAPAAASVQQARGSGSGGGGGSNGGGQPAEPPPPAGAAVAAGVERLVLELGWEVFAPGRDGSAVQGDDEDEPPVVEFAVGVYNLQGEELALLGADNTEAEGVLVDEEEPEALPPGEPEGEQGEDEQQQGGGDERARLSEGEDEPVGDGTEEGEEAGGDGGERQRQETEAARMARVAARAEAAAAAAQAAAANQRPLAEPFPLRRKVHLRLDELPAGARALMVTLSNFSGSGFKAIKSLHARLLLEEPAAPEAAEAAEGSGPAGEQRGEGSAAVNPRRAAGPRELNRVLAHYRYDSVRGADAHLSQALMLKLYREYQDSAFAVWQREGAPSVASLLLSGGSDGGGEPAQGPCDQGLAAALAAGGAGAERAREVLHKVLAARKQVEQELAVARARAEEEGTYDEEEGEPDLRLARGVWRVRVLGAMAGGAGPEDAAELLATLLAYDGDLNASGERSAAAAKVAFPNRDTYCGGYAAGAKSGVGLYVFAGGAAHLGEYRAGRRDGGGVLLAPDGGLYRGGFAADRFDGEGCYIYPDGSCYSGLWRAGRKHGKGQYWDASSGRLAGTWAAGALRGQGQYDQPHYHFEGAFAAGLPSGPCSFTVSSAFRTDGLPRVAASHAVAEHGPTLRCEGRYSLPPGTAGGPSEGEAGGEGEGEGGAGASEVEGGGAPLPSFPKYEGLRYAPEPSLPCGAADVPFPPAGVAPAPAVAS